MLDEMTLLSFTHFVQGPAAAQYLADLGADVVTVEPPGGAWERRVGSGGIRLAGRSVTFLSVNRNKRSIAVDLKHPDAAAVLRPLIERADVLLENYRDGALDRLGLGYEAVRAIKPDIIYASASGWGSRGPMAGRPGVDLLVQARTGLVGVTGDRPTAAGTPVVDQHGAALLAMGVLAAYARKLTTGKGTRVESSLLGAGLDLQAESLALYFSGHRGPEDLRRPAELACWSIDAPYGVYRLKDASIVIAVHGAMDDLGDALGSPVLTGYDQQARRSERDEYTSAVAGVLAGMTYADVAERLGPKGFWFERVAGYDDVRTDPQVAAEGLLGEFDVDGERATVLRHPVRYDGELPGIRTAPAGLGEHTAEVLAAAGFSAGDIDGLRAAGVVFGGED
ncbi:CaiB/BaiF CoA-transferase family protein [Amycolatopsis sp. EV170708-02-1]|uniref:CaiB/BaiF CoA transferase family protein n=1 Tax=Amycolatopsis sp. EV170708-02-1 TaxID=2919322 RepID=UPI001F0CBAA3|nr:CoA transferase [Amycolatopsis sp. EV170708-02-1]UMP06905.1 CoA transferase [Amycolatopsis sp. EV170708-02-1]